MNQTALKIAGIILAATVTAAIILSTVNEASAKTFIYTPIPGTNTPDQTKPITVEKDGIVYPVIPGTRTPDYGSKERKVIRKEN